MREWMKRLAAALLILAGAFTPAAAQEVPANLATPPADAQVYTTFSTAGQHGRTLLWRTADGVRWSRESQLLRGFFLEIDEQVRLDAQGRISAVTVRGVTTSGPADETFTLEGGRSRWQSPVDRGEGGEGLYWVYNASRQSQIAFYEALMRDEDHAMDVLPSGRARLERLTELDVSANGQTKHVVAWSIHGIYWFPLTAWFEENGTFFASVGSLSRAQAGWESVEPQLANAERDALATRAPALVAQIGRRPGAPVVFQNVRMYDATERTFREGMTVIATGNRITAVGPTASTPIPRHAEVIQGDGRTLVPGLWDVHMHFGDDTWGPLMLALGVTNIRDPGNRGEDLLMRIRRINAGEMLGPAIYPSLLIDGPGPRSAQSAVLARTRAEAIALVRQAHEQGYIGVKLYGSLDPALVAPIAREAHRLGLRVQGHVPNGMRPLAAVRAGYDEITHINWVMMQGTPDAIIRDSNGLNRFYGPVRYAAEYDYERGPMAAFFDELARRGTTIDPTIAVFESLWIVDQGEMPLSYAAWTGSLPVAIERDFRSGGIAPTDEVSRDRMRQSYRRIVEGIGALHRRGVPIVAGTDGTGLELIRELEIYVEAGMTPGEALATATINAARSAGVSDRTGSITVGKDADLTLVVGDPSARIGDLRHVEYVMRDGRLMEGAALRGALGIGEPR